jgi:hypothetical protein
MSEERSGRCRSSAWMKPSGRPSAANTRVLFAVVLGLSDDSGGAEAAIETT